MVSGARDDVMVVRRGERTRRQQRVSPVVFEPAG